MSSYFLVYEDFSKFFELSVYENLVGSFILNTCTNLHKGGFCGYSNKTIADRLHISVPSVIRAIKGLKEKEIIILINSGTSGRQIYPNYETLKRSLSLSVDKAQDTEIEQLRNSLKELQSQLDQRDDELNRLKNERVQKEDPYSTALFSFGIPFSEDQKKDIRLRVAPYYADFHKIYSMDLLTAHFQYLKDHVHPEQIHNISAYLLKSLRQWQKTLETLKKEKQKPTIADGSTLPDWYKNTETTPASEELIQKALELQRELFGSKEE